jgi:hypothetical protein
MFAARIPFVSAEAMKTSPSELARPLRLKALAKKLRSRLPNDLKAANLEAGAKYLQKREATRPRDGHAGRSHQYAPPMFRLSAGGCPLSRVKRSFRWISF